MTSDEMWWILEIYVATLLTFTAADTATSTAVWPGLSRTRWSVLLSTRARCSVLPVSKEGRRHG
jgi:hypothetical protein